MKVVFSRQIFEKHSNMKFHENPLVGLSCPCRRIHGQTGVTKLIVAFLLNFANASKNSVKVKVNRREVLKKHAAYVHL